MDDHAYRKLTVWQKSMDMVDAVYMLSKAFPPEEKYGLTSQVRRAAISVPSNIAEGYGRAHRREYVHHLYMARGSLMETETQLITAVRQQMCARDDALAVWEVMQETGRLLHGLIDSLQPSDENT